MAQRAMHRAAWLFAIALLFFVSSARADFDPQTLPDPTAEVLVRTKGGAAYVGRYTFNAETQILVVQLANGESVSLPLGELDSVRATAQLAPQQPPERAAQSQTQVEVQCTLPGAQLERQNPLLAEEKSWQAACTAPCGQLIDNRYRYRIAGPRIAPSNPFDIGGRSTVLTVRAGSDRGARAGLALLISGSSLAGLALLGGGLALSIINSNRRFDLFPIAGSIIGVAAASGLAMGIAGLTLTLKHRTRVAIQRSE